MLERLTPEQILVWQFEAGANEAIGDAPVDRFAVARAQSAQAARPTPSHAVAPRPAPPPAARAAPGPAASAALSEAESRASQLAQACRTVAELKAAVEAFDGCALKKTCQRTVFADGNPEARVMLIGEAPGREEDDQGLPFVGPSGKLLDRMLGSIGLDRAKICITNVIYWRPPANRKPEPAEVDLCLPFVERHIELVDPALIMLLGGAAVAALLGKSEGVSKLRGRWHDYASSGMARPIPAIPTFHPAYLLRTPIHKREAWKDFLSLRKRLDELSITH